MDPAIANVILAADSAQDYSQLVELRFMTISFRHGVSLHLRAAHPQQLDALCVQRRLARPVGVSPTGAKVGAP
jgi:hypothetical protein